MPRKKTKKKATRKQARKKRKKKPHRVPDRRRPGRPPGSPDAPKDSELLFPSRCKRCKSTRRSRFRSTRVQKYNGLDPAGRPATHVVRHLTTCLDCGQVRTVREYPNEPTTETIEKMLAGEIEIAGTQDPVPVDDAEEAQAGVDAEAAQDAEDAPG